MRSALLVAAALLVVGCLGSDPAPAQRTATASDGKASSGWAYDGGGVTGAQASLSAQLDDPQNTGTVHVEFDYHGKKYVVHMAEFKQADGRAFMDGGIEFDLTEHGDSGVADSSIPKILARIAAWGTATVTRDGEVLGGANGTAWNAHLMVSADTVRGSDNKIAKADGAAPYDPSAPADARVVGGDPQAILWIKHPDGENSGKHGVITKTESSQCNMPGCEATWEVDAKGAEHGTLTLNFTAPQPAPSPISAGRATVTLENGTEIVDSREVTITPQGGAQIVFELGEDAPDRLIVRVSGDGVWEVEMFTEVEFDDHSFIVLTWDDVVVA